MESSASLILAPDPTGTFIPSTLDIAAETSWHVIVTSLAAPSFTLVSQVTSTVATSSSVASPTSPAETDHPDVSRARGIGLGVGLGLGLPLILIALAFLWMRFRRVKARNEDRSRTGEGDERRREGEEEEVQRSRMEVCDEKQLYMPSEHDKIKVSRRETIIIEPASRHQWPELPRRDAEATEARMSTEHQAQELFVPPELHELPARSSHARDTKSISSSYYKW